MALMTHAALANHDLDRLASHTVQVTSEAKARPIKTAFATKSAERNIPPWAQIARQRCRCYDIVLGNRWQGDRRDGEPDSEGTATSDRT